MGTMPPLDCGRDLETFIELISTIPSESIPKLLRLSTTMSRLATISRGRCAENQRFSAVQPYSADVAQVLIEAVGPTANGPRRDQILGDPTVVSQFVMAWDTNLGFLTRPRIITDGTFVIGNFTDTLGEPHPVSMTSEFFRGAFTTLVRRADAEALGLAIHPTTPDTIPGPPPDGAATRGGANAPLEATLGRLNFTMPDDPAPGDYPVIAAIPNVIPVGPGQTFPHMAALGDTLAGRDTFLLLDVYRQGILYVRTHNGGHSVTRGGPLFHLPGLAVALPVVDPFASLPIVTQAVVNPTNLSPTQPLYQQAVSILRQWSESSWYELGSRMPAAPPLEARALGFSPEDFKNVLTPLVNKEKKFRLADRSGSRWKLFLAGEPPPDGPPVGDAVLPDLRTIYNEFLANGTSSTAADDLKEFFREKLILFQASGLAVEKGVTLEPDNITLAFSDKLRCFNLLDDKLITTSLAGARAKLGLLHMLTPNRDALASVAELDKESLALVMANSTSSSAQLDASKNSKVYTGGQLKDFQDAYTCVINMRAILGLAVDDLTLPMVIRKLLEYAELLVTREGRLFFMANRHVPGLAVHPWQDLQTILSVFVTVATNPTLTSSVTAGNTIAWKNYASAVAVANVLIQDLKATLHGNGLGKFQYLPTCSAWFPVSTPRPPAPGKGRTPAAHDEAQPPKRPKENPLDPEEYERRCSFGILQFDRDAAGTTRLPVINVYKKKKGAKTPERLCNKFLIKGHCCLKTGGECKFPHLSNLDTLPDADKKKLVDFVRLQPGLSWVEGKAPSGTT